MELRNAASVPRSEKILKLANCLAADVVGDTVRITGPKVASKIQVAAVTSAGALPSIGVIIKKTGTTDCQVQCDGPVRGVYTGLTPNATYVVGTDNRPATVGDANYPTVDPIQQIGIATSDDELLVGLQDISAAGAMMQPVLTLGETVVLGDLLTLDSAGDAVRAGATFSAGIWKLTAVARAGGLAAATIDVSLAGELVPVRFSSAPGAGANNSLVFLSTSPGEGTLTPPVSSGTVVYVVGLLQGADGVSLTPTVAFDPQFIIRRP
jgi:hypothetical protein